MDLQDFSYNTISDSLGPKDGASHEEYKESVNVGWNVHLFKGISWRNVISQTALQKFDQVQNGMLKSLTDMLLALTMNVLTVLVLLFDSWVDPQLGRWC